MVDFPIENPNNYRYRYMTGAEDCVQRFRTTRQMTAYFERVFSKYRPSDYDDRQDVCECALFDTDCKYMVDLDIFRHTLCIYNKRNPFEDCIYYGVRGTSVEAMIRDAMRIIDTIFSPKRSRSAWCYSVTCGKEVFLSELRITYDFTGDNSSPSTEVIE